MVKAFSLPEFIQDGNSDESDEECDDDSSEYEDITDSYDALDIHMDHLRYDIYEV